MENIRAALDRIAELETMMAALEERLRESSNKTAVVEERVNELKRSGEEASRRLWSLLPPLIGAGIGALLTLLIQRLLR